ncbi:hypothetical protein [Sphingomonas bacterium]|uniref:hypothetical protein n=1 Tax=Sphingomonas bacterium TaxID=1895847 RepID=UPI0020C68EC9|nr:hypothetical protein [Sphingomonas bacterium]
MTNAPLARLLAASFATLGLAVATPAPAAPCKDAKGKFVKCPPAKPPVASGAARCKTNGKFAKCGTPGAKPV